MATPEPVAIGGAVGALIPLVAGATAVFEVWNPSPEQVTALGALYAGVLVVITLITRSKVTPNENVVAEAGRIRIED